MTRFKSFTLWFWGVIIALLATGFLIWLFFLRHFVYTDDAYVQGNQVYITPLHDGFVTSIHTDDSFLVEKGQLLVTLDQTDAKIAFEHAQESLAQTVRQVCATFHQVSVYRAEIDLKIADLVRNCQDYFHRFEVFKDQGVSIEDFEHAIAALKSQYASLQMTIAMYQKTLAEVQNTSISTHPLVIASSDALRDAWVKLYRCNIYSPVTGLAAQRTIQVGMWVPSGQPLMSVIPLDQIWVNANYKETQLKHMRLGQKVDITADLWGIENVFHGKIVGLPGGAGNVFSLLPPQNLSGNWIKIVQRLPVRVELDPEEIRQKPLRVGLTCRAIVDIRDQKGSMIPENTDGSPLYETSIFEIEEKGDLEFIKTIISENLDPLLSDYFNDKLVVEKLNVELPKIFKLALEMDAKIHDQTNQDRVLSDE